MKKLFKNFPNDRIVFWGFNISIFLILSSILLILIFYQFLPPFLPIYNKMPWGYARVGAKIEFFIPVGISFIIYVANLLLSSYIHKNSVLLARFLSATTILLCAATFIFVIQVILLVK